MWTFTKLNFLKVFSSGQLLSHVQLFVTSWTAARKASLYITNSWSLHKLMSTVSSTYPTISSSVVPFSSCFQSVPASRSFQMSQFFTSGAQSIGVSASASVLPVNIQDWFLLGWLVGPPCSPRDSQESSPTLQFKSISSPALSFPYSPTVTSIHDYWKKTTLTRWTFVSKVMSLFFNMLSIGWS